MGDNTSLLQWGAQHFARIHWRAVNLAARTPDQVFRQIFNQDADVALLSRYLNELGYQWGFLTDNESVSYSFALQKDQTPMH